MSLIFHSSNMICMVVDFLRYLSFLVFSELSGPVIWYLSLILGHSHSFLLQIFLLLFSLCICYTFCNYPTVWYSIHFLIPFFSLHFSYGSFHWHLFKPAGSFVLFFFFFFFCFIQSIDELSKPFFISFRHLTFHFIFFNFHLSTYIILLFLHVVCLFY